MTPSPPEARPRDLYRDYIKADVELEYETWLEVELRELQEAARRVVELEQAKDYASLAGALIVLQDLLAASSEGTRMSRPYKGEIVAYPPSPPEAWLRYHLTQAKNCCQVGSHKVARADTALLHLEQAEKFAKKVEAELRELQEELERIADDPARALSLRERGVVA